MKLHRFMRDIDTCPMCGGELYPRENGSVGVKAVERIPGETIFVLVCDDLRSRAATCGEFRISRVDPTTLDDDWKCEYVPIGEDFTP